jgi:hypothetical protein
MTLVWYDPKVDGDEFMAELSKVRKMCTRRSGYFGTESHERVQAIMTAIDEYAKFKTGNLEYFWKRPVTSHKG